MTKIITNIANESASFEKEEMRPLADLVAKSIPLVRNFYDLILKSEIIARVARSTLTLLTIFFLFSDRVRSWVRLR